MPRRFRIPVLVLAAVVATVVAMLPPAARRTGPLPASTVRGAFHIHSSRSDGSGSVDEIAAAAFRAGLQFIILTDHGDGTREPDPPAYRGGVLTIDGVELNTTGGHYAAFGLPASPYPIAGTPADVIDDVHRLGGFGFAAHPGSPRPSLSWQDWQAPIDGLEWMNADSEWRDEPRLPMARALVTYLFRAPESMARLLDRPASVLRRWDELTAMRQVVGLAGDRRTRPSRIRAANRSGRRVGPHSVARLRVIVSGVFEPCRTRRAALGECGSGRVTHSRCDSRRPCVQRDRCPGDAGRPAVHGDERTAFGADGREPRD